MLPRKEFTSDLNSSPEKAKAEWEDLVAETKTLALNSTFASGGNSFRLSNKKNWRNMMFARPVILAEIKGHVEESELCIKIELKPLMGVILLVDTLILLLFAYGSFDSGEVKQGFLLIGFIGGVLGLSYLVLKNEISYLEKELSKIKGIKPAGKKG